MPHLALRCQHETPTGTLRRSFSEVVAAAGSSPGRWPRRHRPPGGIGRPVCGLAEVGVHRRAAVRVFLFVSLVR